MVNIGNLLDTCGIFYTERQIVKLDKLVKMFLKQLSLQHFVSNETTKHDSIPYSRSEDFASKIEITPSQHSIQELNIEPEPCYNNTIFDEIPKESEIEIKEEFPKDPLASLETINNSKDISDMLNEENVESNSFPRIEKKLQKIAKTAKKRPSLSLSVSLHCPLCNFETSRKGCLDAHIKSHISCEQCGQVFLGKRQLAVHLTTHKPKKNYLCDFCNMDCKKCSNKKKHIKICKKRPEGVILLDHKVNKPFKCNECDKAFSHKRYLKVHIESIHQAKLFPTMEI